MRKTIFQRYLKITMMIVVISFIMLGTVMIAFFTHYWQNEQKDTLEKNAASVAFVSGYTLPLVNEDNHVTEIISGILNNYAQTLEADIFITDLEGRILLGSANSSGSQLKKTISPAVLDSILKSGEYEARGTLDGFYEDDYFIVGIPLTTAAPHSEESTIGAVFAAKSASPFNSFMQEALRIFLLAAILALALSFIVIGFFAYNLVRPLRQMSAAVNRFATGDFSVRVPVTSEDEIGHLALSFNNMANSLSGSEGMRRSFIANVSHELKTPMTTIAGFIDGILDGTIPKESQKKYLYIVSEEVKRLSRLVKSMLDLSRIDSGEMHIQPQKFDLPDMIVKILLTFERSVEEKHLEIRGLESVGKITVYGDQDLLYQVVYNLIENAVKFVEVNGYIEFIITDSIDRTSVAIKNSGDGIDPEELSMIFDRFYKTDKSRSKDKKGMGLGLYIVKTILKLHGGDIFVSSELHKYTRFEFYIPKTEPEAPKEKDKKEKKDSKEFTVYDAEIVETPDAARDPSDSGKKNNKERDSK